MSKYPPYAHWRNQMSDPKILQISTVQRLGGSKPERGVDTWSVRGDVEVYGLGEDGLVYKWNKSIARWYLLEESQS